MIVLSLSPTPERMGHNLCSSTCKNLLKIWKMLSLTWYGPLMLSLTWSGPLYNNGKYNLISFFITLSPNFLQWAFLT